MDILVVGGGGREHALIKSIKKNPAVRKIYAAPGNGGMARDAELVPIGAKELERLVDFAVEHKIDYAVVAPDDPLVMGLTDRLKERGIPSFGPDKKAALIEGSKAFAKNMMRRYGIPTASYETFDDMAEAIDYVDKCPLPVVVKADGLALGKGVLICGTRAEAGAAVKGMMQDRIFGESGSRIVIEEFLQGPEVSVLTFTDGKTLVPMVASMDHKRAHDGDTGLNTGGMGAIAPNPFYTEAIAERCMRDIFLPTVRAMNAEGRSFRGCLYFGLMLTEEGPRVIEYNCRFGDPEAQVVLPLLKSDLLDIMMHVSEGTLSECEVEFSDDSACCVIMASGGYPQKYPKGLEISVNGSDRDIYYAGTKLTADGRLVTDGGRVLGVTKVAGTLPEAISLAYEAIRHISFDNAYYRRDIGARALEALEVKNGL